MPKYENQLDSTNSICPYCLDSYQVETEDYDEDQRVVQCDNCGKKYYLHQEFSVDHITEPDCELNGEKHEYEIKHTRVGSGMFCKICGKLELREA